MSMLTYALQIIESMELGAQTSVYTEKLLVHDRGKRKRAERFHACFVNRLGVLVLAFELESEVVCQVPAFVIASKEPKGIWIPDLERPQVENALVEVSKPPAYANV